MIIVEYEYRGEHSKRSFVSKERAHKAIKAYTEQGATIISYKEA